MYIGIGGCIFGRGPRPIGGPQSPLCGGGGLKSLGPVPSHGPMRGGGGQMAECAFRDLEGGEDHREESWEGGVTWEVPRPGIGWGEGPGDMECILAGDGASEGMFEQPLPNGTGRKRLSCMEFE